MNPEWTEKTSVTFIVSATIRIEGVDYDSIMVPVKITVVVCEAVSISNSYSYQVYQEIGN